MHKDLYWAKRRLQYELPRRKDIEECTVLCTKVREDYSTHCQEEITLENAQRCALGSEKTKIIIARNK